jgi:hypothetical protein
MDFENSAGSNDLQAKDDKDYQAEMLLSAISFPESLQFFEIRITYINYDEISHNARYQYL